MLNKLLIIVLLFTTSVLRTQELIEFSMGSGYQYDIYYSLTNGITAYPERSNWELAFSTNESDNNIRINSGNGVVLFQVSNNLNEWDQIESIPIDAIQLRNSNVDWSDGAFVVNALGELNYGWGTYNPENQTTEGNNIYIINYGIESKKLKINSLYDGNFYFTIANLDGSNEQNINLNTSAYSDKKFIYYSLNNMEIVDREPSIDNWDLVFTKYEEDLNKLNNDDELFYTVTGALSNNNIIFEYDGFLDVNPSAETILNSSSNSINTIGWDWKVYGGGGFSIVPDRAYFILNQQANSMYKIIFQSFSGGASGNCSFLIEDIPYNPTYVSEIINFDSLTISPNPSSGYFTINSTQNTANLTIVNASGRIILNEQHHNHTNIDLSNFQEGLYFVILESNEQYVNRKIIIQR
tara:strand:+ start:1484 stop:2710 length:1227 start_codon:yes stop_codon:yes gene_type:complete